jgi:hypothetical protein
MAIAQATLVKRVRRRLDDEPWETTITNSPTASASSTTVGVPDGTQWTEGDIGEFTDGERVRVVSVSSNNLTVKRGHDDTTITAHTTGDVILKEPEYAFVEIVEAIERTIDDLWPWVYVVSSTTLTAVSSKRYYDLPTAFKALVSVTQDVTSTSGQYRLLEYGAKGSGYVVGVARGLPTTIATSGTALYMPDVRITPTTSIIVRYARLISSTASGGNYADLEDGLEADAVVTKAIVKLLEDREIQRVVDDVQQGDIGVQPNAVARDAAFFDQKGDQLLRQWRLRLDREAPLMGEWKR